VTCIDWLSGITICLLVSLRAVLVSNIGFAVMPVCVVWSLRGCVRSTDCVSGVATTRCVDLAATSTERATGGAIRDLLSLRSVFALGVIRIIAGAEGCCSIFLSARARLLFPRSFVATLCAFDRSGCAVG
jgi:hypothetical protein